MPLNTSRTRLVRTYSRTRTASAPRAHSPQYGHWTSAYSTSVTGAFGEPSAFPCCGIPARSAEVSAPPTMPSADGVDDLPPSAVTSTSTPAARTARHTDPPTRARRESGRLRGAAFRTRGAWTGRVAIGLIEAALLRSDIRVFPRARCGEGLILRELPGAAYVRIAPRARRRPRVSEGAAGARRRGLRRERDRLPARVRRLPALPRRAG